MSKPYILHMFTTTANLSPFDVNMARDAGWETIVPYTNVDVEDVASLVQDTIFSRSPSGIKHTGIFIGGRDMQKSLQMLEAARNAMVPPFEVSVMADPSGAFTTAAGMIAAVNNALLQAGGSWEASQVLVAGGTGPVGLVASILAANLGAKAIIMSRSQDRASAAADTCRSLLKGQGELCGIAQDSKSQVLAQTQVVLATAAAGVEVLSAADLKAAAQLKVAADVNAVPPSGVAGLDVMSGDSVLADSSSGAVGIGALAIGNIKYQAQHRLLKQMCETDKPLYLHYEDACLAAREYVAEKSG